MKRTLILFSIVAVWATLSVAALAAETPPCGRPLPAVVGTVNGEQIARAAVLLRLKTPGLESCRLAIDEALRALLVRQHAEAYRLRVSASEVSAAMQDFRDSFAAEDELSRFLAERDASKADLERMIEDRIFLKAIDERQVRSWVFSDELQEEYFAQHRSELAKDRAKVRHVLVATREDAERIRRELMTRDRTLADLAGAYSLDEQTKDQGGDLGWIERGVMPPAFDQAVYSLGFGVVSAPVQTPLGWHLIQVEDRKLAADQTLEDHRTRVIRLLQEEEWALQRDSWWNDVRHDAKIWITPELASDAEMVHAE